MSKKETEFDRFDRMKKLEREAEVEKRKTMDLLTDQKKKGGRPKPSGNAEKKSWGKSLSLAMDEDY